MCKCLQENIPIFRRAGLVTSEQKDALIGHNQLRVKDKTHLRPKTTEGRKNRPMVNQLHSFLTTRGGSWGSC
jgi:hypothetical protein